MGLYTFIVISLYVRTDHLMACFTLSSRLSRCTATSMRPTTPPLSALAVTSMRLRHFWWGWCIPTGQKLRWVWIGQKNSHSPNKWMVGIRQVWPYNVDRTYFPPLHLDEPLGHDLVHSTLSWCCAWIVQISWKPQLQGLEKWPRSVQFIKLQSSLDMPFLSGQISLKYFESRDGRSLSVGMQYLRSSILCQWL